MLQHTVKVFPSKIHLPKKKQLAWKIAEIASDNAKLNKEAIATEALSIILLITISIASLLSFALSLAISAIFQASCFFFGKCILEGKTLTVCCNKITPY